MTVKYVRFLLILVAIAAGQPTRNVIDIDPATTSIDHQQVYRYRRLLKPHILSCSHNQYYDTHEGRCLGVAGGGRAISIDHSKSCGINILKPHCTNPEYYYICKKNKIILAQCAEGQHFENRLKRCVYADSNDSSSHGKKLPNQESIYHVETPICKKPGRFPVPNHCALFYTCETNGHRMFQNVLQCPHGMEYDPLKEVCTFSSTCGNTKSNSSVQICVPYTNQQIIMLEDKIQPETTSFEGANTEHINLAIYATTPVDSQLEYIASTESYDGTTIGATYEDEGFTPIPVQYTDLIPRELAESTDNPDITLTSIDSALGMSRSLNTVEPTATSLYTTTNADDQHTIPYEEINGYTEIGTTESAPEPFEDSSTKPELSKKNSRVDGEMYEPMLITTDDTIYYDKTMQSTTEFQTTDIISTTSPTDLSVPITEPRGGGVNSESTDYVACNSKIPSSNESCADTIILNTPGFDEIESTTSTYFTTNPTYGINTAEEFMPRMSDNITDNITTNAPEKEETSFTTESLEPQYFDDTSDDFVVSSNTETVDYSVTGAPMSQRQFTEGGTTDGFETATASSEPMIESSETHLYSLEPIEPTSFVNYNLPETTESPVTNINTEVYPKVEIDLTNGDESDEPTAFINYNLPETTESSVTDINTEVYPKMAIDSANGGESDKPTSFINYNLPETTESSITNINTQLYPRVPIDSVNGDESDKPTSFINYNLPETTESSITNTNTKYITEVYPTVPIYSPNGDKSDDGDNYAKTTSATAPCIYTDETDQLQPITTIAAPTTVNFESPRINADTTMSLPIPYSSNRANTKSEKYVALENPESKSNISTVEGNSRKLSSPVTDTLPGTTPLQNKRAADKQSATPSNVANSQKANAAVSFMSAIFNINDRVGQHTRNMFHRFGEKNNWLKPNKLGSISTYTPAPRGYKHG